MKISLTALPNAIVQKREQTKVPQAEEKTVLQQMKESKQAIKETVQRQLSEMQEARTDMGEDDPKAQRYIEKFKNGKKLTPEEMAYVRKNAPGIVDYMNRIMREREMIEFSMKMAPTKTDVQMAAFRAGKQFEKHYNGEEREIRAKHLADAKHEYEKTDEYKEKPNSPLDKEEKPVKVRIKRNEQQQLALAKTAYEPLKHNEKQITISFEQ